VSPEEQVQPFDEKAALEELERLRESIQAARRARQRTSDEFEAFVKGFRTPASTPIAERPVATSRAPVTPQVASESIGRSDHPPDPPASTLAVPSNTDSFDDRTARRPSHLLRRYRLSIRSLGIVVIVGLIALSFLSTRWRRGAPTPTTVSTVSGNAGSPRSGAASPPPASAASPPSVAAPAVAIELRVIRPVWMRVVVDGRKDVEGMVQAGEPLHFAGDHSIVVRVGNGGDVVVKTGDREESFGEAAQPLTRTFSKR